MSSGPVVPVLTPVLDLAVDCDPPQSVGRVPGGRRWIIPITGGSFTGVDDVELKGTILPGGADWNLQRDDLTFDVWARYTLRTDAGELLMITNTGLITIDGTDVFSRTVARFEVGAAELQWLTRWQFVGVLTAREPFTGVDIRLYRLA
jgi:hypothetical protein